MTVKKVSRQTANEWITKKHYRHTLGIFWEGFGLYELDELQGVICYGQPSAPIQKYAFKGRDFRLYELTRLVIQTKTRNAASFLIGNSLKMLSSKPCAIISYADSSMGHCGYVYQATNWIYTGAVKAHDNFYIVDGEILHPTSIRDRFGVTSPMKWAKQNDVKTIAPANKYRYFYFIGTKRKRKMMASALNYSAIQKYPKCELSRYDDGPVITPSAQIDLF